MARHKDVNWDLPAVLTTLEECKIAIFMDIRDELKLLNKLLHCSNFLSIPQKLDQISINTTKKPRKRK